MYEHLHRFELFLSKIQAEKTNFANLSAEDTLTLCGLLRNGQPTLAVLMLFGMFPQANFPAFGITAVVIPGYVMGENDASQ